VGALLAAKPPTGDLCADADAFIVESVR